MNEKLISALRLVLFKERLKGTWKWPIASKNPFAKVSYSLSSRSLTLSERHSTTSSPLSPSPDSASSDASHRQGSPVLTPNSDITSSSSETDQVPNATEKPARKRRKRATFTQREKMQLEMAFRYQPYLTGDDEKVLAQRLGLTAKNVRVS